MKNKISQINASRGVSRRHFVAGASTLGAAFVTSTSLTLPRRAQAAKSGGTLRAALAGGSTTDSLDPATYVGLYIFSVGFATHNTLTEVAPDGSLVGDLAESWESSSDARTWTFKLRRGVTFHHGKTLDPEDVIASLNHHRGDDSKSSMKSLLDPITTLRAEGSDRIVITLADGNADFAYILADYHLLVMPAVDGKADWESYHGTGGYTLVEHEPGVRSVLRRNPNYWKEGRAHFDDVELIAVSDTAARQNALLTGEVDLINRVDLKTVDLLGEKSGVRIQETTGLIHYLSTMNTSVAPFNDRNVRLALKYGVDREALVQTLLRGHAAVGNDHPISPSMQFHNGELEQRRYDPDKAKFHLKKAGIAELKIDLSAADTAFTGAVDSAVLMKEHGSKAGIAINVIREPADGYWSNVWMKKPYIMSYWGGRPTCDFMFSVAYAAGAPWNDSFWEHDRFNQLLLEARRETKLALRAEMYGEMQSILHDDGGAVVWAFPNYVDALNENVGVPDEIAGNWELDGGRFIEKWWKNA